LAMIGRVLVLMASIVAAPTLWGSADSIFCGNQLVRAGDPIWQVARKCPEPFWQESYDRARAVDRFGRALELQRMEVWTLNFGQRRLMRRLVFVNGRLSRIHALGYGVDFPPGSRRCAPRELATAGDTIAEIYARCGEPDYSYDIPSPGVYGYHGGPAQQERRLWTYDFGARHHPRELMFVDGRLHTIRTQRR
jgi:hypothetical protein